MNSTHQNKKFGVEFQVSGAFALFTDPLTKLGGEKFTYQIPTYQALKGILESIYWKPTIIWVVDSVRIMNRIQTRSKGIRSIKYSDGNDISIYTYLSDVEYQVKAHFIWNPNRPDLESDRIPEKHLEIAKRMIEHGGRRDIFLGTRECQGYVEPCRFGSGSGAYDTIEELSFGLMFHGFTYPDESNNGKMYARLWHPIMKHGIIEFPKPDKFPNAQESLYSKEIRTQRTKLFVLHENLKSVEEELNDLDN